MNTIDVRVMTHDDIALICEVADDAGGENVSYLERQLENQEKNECTALIALYDGEVAGHVFLYYKLQVGWSG